VREYEYGIAGQLLAVTDPDGARAGYAYDGLGRRNRLIAPDGSWTEYAWGANRSLAGTTVRTPEGGEVSRHRLWVDALGELAGVDDAELWVACGASDGSARLVGCQLIEEWKGISPW
jgi:YD repeat-containing protein